MFDKDKGWALTEDNELLFTDNGVENFVPVRKFDGINKTNDYFMGICVVNERNVYAAYLSEEGNLTVEYTKDGGKSWKQTLVEWNDDSEEGSFEAWGSVYISFSDEKNGYVLYCSSPAAGLMTKKLFYTTDAGESFSYAGELSEISGYPQGFTVSGGKIYIAVSPRGEEHYLYVKEETSELWKSQEIITLPGGARYLEALVPIYDMREEQNGMMVLKAVGDNVNYLLLVTIDGGESWTQIGEIPLDSVRSYSCIGANQFYLIDGSGNLFEYSRL